MNDGSRDTVVRRRGSRRSGKGPTIADVAREAGVSPMTVSRVVNNETNVVAATREKVERAIAHLGYVPNQAARALAGGQQCRIALVHDNPSAAWMSAILVACLEQASLSDAQLLVERCDDHEAIDRLAGHLVLHRIDGVILLPPLAEDARLLDALRAIDLPVVQIAAGRPEPAANAVGVDEVQAALEMTRHLIGLGHRRIGFIMGNASHSASALRCEGYEAALAEAGIAADPALIVAGEFSYRTALDAADGLLMLSNRPTAIFASNDDMAAAAVAAAHRRGLDVPGDLSVCGFDDTAIATMIWPQLTTVRQPIGEMARKATALLIGSVRAKLTNQRIATRHECLPFTIVRRESDAPFPGIERQSLTV